LDSFILNLHKFGNSITPLPRPAQEDLEETKRLLELHSRPDNPLDNSAPAVQEWLQYMKSKFKLPFAFLGAAAGTSKAMVSQFINGKLKDDCGVHQRLAR